MQAFSLGIKGVNKALRFILTAFYLSEDLTSRSKLRAPESIMIRIDVVVIQYFDLSGFT